MMHVAERKLLETEACSRRHRTLLTAGYHTCTTQKGEAMRKKCGKGTGAKVLVFRTTGGRDKEVSAGRTAWLKKRVTKLSQTSQRG